MVKIVLSIEPINTIILFADKISGILEIFLLGIPFVQGKKN
jgi:hypothetical protein